MPVDRPTPLATKTQMERSRLRDLIADMDQDEITDALVRATRACESYTGRRLAPFTGLTELLRAEGADIDELSSAGLIAGDLAYATSSGYGSALGGDPTNWVRRAWVRQRPPLYQELWTYSDVSITLLHSAVGQGAVQPNRLIGGGIDADTGLLWFRLGTFLPRGSKVRVTYSGGYRTIPADLSQACLYMAAADLVDEEGFPDAVSTNSHSSKGSTDGGYLARACKLLDPYMANT